jgi:transcriptional regulator with XRE-family HTH domain
MRLPIHGYALRTARLNAGVTAPDLAEQLGVTPNCVWRWEGFHEDIGIRPANWEALQAALGHHLEEAANGSPAEVGAVISQIRKGEDIQPTGRRVAYEVTIAGVMICEHGVDPADGDMDSIYYDETFSLTALVDSVRLVPVPRSYQPREVREARDGGDQ